MAMIGSVPVGNLLLYGVIVLAPTLGFWLLLRAPATFRWARHRLRPPPVTPAHPPIQLLAADLRRVHRLLADFGPGTPAARRNGTRQAYDALLEQACEALEVEHRLRAQPSGIDREIERLRVEEALRDKGLMIP